MTLKINNIDKYLKITSIDCHTEGEPLRIITGGYPEPHGNTMLEKRRYLLNNFDHYRKLLMFEPRGHGDMYGALITKPVSTDADFGILFLHNEGYSSMCGHGIIATVTALFECGEISLKNNETKQIKIDSPAGDIFGYISKTVTGVDVNFDCVPSFVETREQKITLPGIGEFTFDIAFGGAYYVFVDADQHDIDTSQHNVEQLIKLGRQLKQAVSTHIQVVHPEHQDLSFIYGTIFHSKQTVDHASHSKHVCIFADGEVDRSPTGTGVSARSALLKANGEIIEDQSLQIESIIGTKMSVMIKQELIYKGKKAVIPTVGGSAFITGQHEFLLDPNDPLQQGFLLR